MPIESSFDLRLKKYLALCGIKDLYRITSIHAFGIESDYSDNTVKAIHKRIYSFDELRPNYNGFYRTYNIILIILDDGSSLTIGFTPHKWEEFYRELG